MAKVRVSNKSSRPLPSHHDTGIQYTIVCSMAYFSILLYTIVYDDILSLKGSRKAKMQNSGCPCIRTILINPDTRPTPKAHPQTSPSPTPLVLLPQTLQQPSTSLLSSQAQQVYTFSPRRDHIIPKSLKCGHSATKLKAPPLNPKPQTPKCKSCQEPLRANSGSWGAPCPPRPRPPDRPAPGERLSLGLGGG